MMIIAFWRTIFLYILVIFSLRFMGKRQIGELQPSELVTTIMISNIAAIPIENMETPLLIIIIPILLLACLEIIFAGLSLEFRGFRSVIMGHPRTLIRNGVIDQKEMRQLRWTIDDLTEQLRLEGIFELSDIEFAIVETNGQLSIFQSYNARPLNNKDAGKKPPVCDCPPMVVISDRVIDKEALSYCNMTEDELEIILKKENLSQRDIFIMTCNPTKNYKIIKREI